MLRKILPALTIVAIFLAACGQQGTPTMSPEEVSGTAVAAAWTIVAETQAAIPTNTPIPPTETPSPTPLPTFTLEPLPTIEIAPPTATSKPQGSCEGPLNVAEAGPQSNIRIENETGGNVTLSLHLGEGQNAFGQCGFLGYQLTKNQKLVVSIPKGLYYAFALIDYGNSSGNASGYVNNRVGDNHLFVVKIKKEAIVVP
ncbi:MAG: hypothetical protein JNM46_02470 [Anaerolineales bacterium]|nr:hypothetical protein [Anaerolineales bacterium]